MRVTFLSIVLFAISNIGNAQLLSKPIENGAIFFMRDGSKYVGEVVSGDLPPYKLKILTEDTITIQPLHADKIYLSDEISLYKNSKFHYKSGLMYSFHTGLGVNHSDFNSSLTYRFQEKYEVGVGFGIHGNRFRVPSSNGFFDGTMVSMPLFMVGKYYLTKNSFRIYTTAKIGYANSAGTWEIDNPKGGLMLEGGLGMLFASKTKSKIYIEISQYTSNGSGTITQNGFPSNSEISFNLWFNRLLFTYGMIIGR